MNNADLFDLFGMPGDEPPKGEGEAAPARFLPPNPAPPVSPVSSPVSPAMPPGFVPAVPAAPAGLAGQAGQRGADAASGAMPSQPVAAPAPAPDLFGELSGFAPVLPGAPTALASPAAPRARTSAPRAPKPGPSLGQVSLPVLPDLLALPDLPELPPLPALPDLPAVPDVAAPDVQAAQRLPASPVPPTSSTPAFVPPLVGVESSGQGDADDEDGDDFWSGPPITPLPQPVFSPKAAPAPSAPSVPVAPAVPASPAVLPTPAVPAASPARPHERLALNPVSKPVAPPFRPEAARAPVWPDEPGNEPSRKPADQRTNAPSADEPEAWSDWPPVDASDAARDWAPVAGDDWAADNWIDEVPPPSAEDWGEPAGSWPDANAGSWDEAPQREAADRHAPKAKGQEDAQRDPFAAETVEAADAPAPFTALAPVAPVAPPASLAPVNVPAAAPALAPLDERQPAPFAKAKPEAAPPSSAQRDGAANPAKPPAAPKPQLAEALAEPLPAADLSDPQAQAHLRQHLRAWVAAEQLRELDLALADFLLELEPQMAPLTLLGAVLASHQLGRGHVCLDLAACLRAGARTLAWRHVPVPVGDGVLAVSGTHRQISDGEALILGVADSAAPQAPALLARAEAAPAGHPGATTGATTSAAADASDAANATANAAIATAIPPTGIEAAPDSPAMLPTPMDWLAGVSLAQWQAALSASAQVLAGAGASPLVLQGARLYLRRQWQDEHSVRAAIVARVGQAAQLRQRWATSRWQSALDALFGQPARADMDWQRAACALAASQGFCIITGGPGTGKTTTVVKLLALLQAMALAPAPGDGAESASSGQPLRIALAAPTGKAAARLGESIAGALKRLQLGELAAVLQVPALAPARKDQAPQTGAERLYAAIPSEAQTLHRVLGPRAESRHFRHHAHNPLPVDVLVVDEASMVDLDMMARLMGALPPGARLVLLGDKDQLASVEAGAVLGELCSRAQLGHFNAATVDWLQAVTGQRVPPALCDAQGTPLDQAVVMLRHSHRFGADSGIGQLAAAVNAGQVRAVSQLRLKPPADLQWLAVPNAQAPELAQLLREGVLGAAPSGPLAYDELGRLSTRQGYAHYLRVMHEGEAAWRSRAKARREGSGAGEGEPPIDEADLSRWALDVLNAHRRFQLLCALREGPWGVSGLNRRIASILTGAGLVLPQGSWWAGRPVMVTGNDYGLSLMNGDIGVTLQRPDRLAVAFADPTRPGGVRWVAPSRLTQVETVFAMTVHKSQGSEFAHTALAVPPQWNPVLTRELVYTAITRASQWCSIVLAGNNGEAVLDMAVKRRVLRASGLLADV